MNRNYDFITRIYISKSSLSFKYGITITIENMDFLVHNPHYFQNKNYSDKEKSDNIRIKLKHTHLMLGFSSKSLNYSNYESNIIVKVWNFFFGIFILGYSMK